MDKRMPAELEKLIVVRKNTLCGRSVNLEYSVNLSNLSKNFRNLSENKQ